MIGRRVEVQGVNKTYVTRVPSDNFFRAFLLPHEQRSQAVFQELNLQVAAGEKVLICAKNGRGKTTLLRMLAGFSQPDRGKISIGEIDSKRVSKSDIGIMLEDFFLYHGASVIENLRLNSFLHKLKNADQRVQESIAEWNLQAFAYKRISQLSNGQKALVGLARSTVHQPGLLLWDEPHVYLSQDNFHLLINNIRRSRQTIIITSARRFEVSAFSRVIEL